jgi:hypothetical protein
MMATLNHMKTATVRDLRYRFPEVERSLSAGRTITITKGRWRSGPPRSLLLIAGRPRWRGRRGCGCWDKYILKYSLAPT